MAKIFQGYITIVYVFWDQGLNFSSFGEETGTELYSGSVFIKEIGVHVFLDGLRDTFRVNKSNSFPGAR